LNRWRTLASLLFGRPQGEGDQVTVAQPHALLLGVPTYDDPELSLPPGVRLNVGELRDALADPEIGAIPQDRCHVVFPGSREDVLQTVADASEDDGPLIVYWAGHGSLAADGRLYLATSDSDASDLDTWVPADVVAQGMSTPHGTTDRLFILDVCFASATTHVPTDRRLLRRALDHLARHEVAVLCSSGTTRLGFAANGFSPSVFTGHLAALLRVGVPSDDSALHLGYLYENLVELLRQSGYREPCLLNAGGFRASLALNRQHTDQHRPYLPARQAASELLHRSAQRHAVAIGIPLPTMRGRLGAGLTRVRPLVDARKVYRALLEYGAGFTSRTTSLVVDPRTWEDVREVIRRAASDSDNALLVYVAASGAASRSGDHLDLLLTLPAGPSIALSELVYECRQSFADTVTLVVDVCSDTAVEQSSRSRRFHGRLPAWDQRTGTSQLFMAWQNLVARLPDAGPSQSTARGAVPDGSKLPMPLVGSPYERQPPWRSPDRRNTNPSPWIFDFPGAHVWATDAAGPLSLWRSLLGTLSTESVMFQRPFRRSGARNEPADPFLALPHAFEGMTSSGAAAPPVPLSDQAEGPVRKGQTASPPADGTRIVRRGHRARLTVDDGTLPARLGRELAVCFDYLPLDEPWQPDPAIDATEDHPLDITVRIRATSAEVSPTLLHLKLTDQNGTRPGRFHVVPRSPEPVELTVDVMRSADWAVLQEITAVLPVDHRDGEAQDPLQ
jgi:hypothetical protein